MTIWRGWGRSPAPAILRPIDPVLWCTVCDRCHFAKTACGSLGRRPPIGRLVRVSLRVPRFAAYTIKRVIRLRIAGAGLRARPRRLVARPRRPRLLARSAREASAATRPPTHPPGLRLATLAGCRLATLAGRLVSPEASLGAHYHHGGDYRAVPAATGSPAPHCPTICCPLPKACRLTRPPPPDQWPGLWRGPHPPRR